MKTRDLGNSKGGVGKSAVASLLTHCFAEQGHRVLAIDLDHQSNFSKPLCLSGQADVLTLSVDALLTEPADVVIVPSGSGLMTLERQRELHHRFGAHLRNFLLCLSGDAQLGFDVCVIDTHPQSRHPLDRCRIYFCAPKPRRQSTRLFNSIRLGSARPAQPHAPAYVSCRLCRGSERPLSLRLAGQPRRGF
jgi:hypothetical protein